jgi:hypothetical protein
MINLYSWIQGLDNHPHKIGFQDGIPVVEKIGENVYILSDSDATHYHTKFHNFNNTRNT